MIGVIGLALKKTNGFFILLISNIILIYVGMQTADYASVALFIAYFVVNVFGIYQWKKGK
jgi:nicotinamide riboside transporter PnuC